MSVVAATALICLIVGITDGDTLTARCEAQADQPSQTLKVRWDTCRFISSRPRARRLHTVRSAPHPAPATTRSQACLDTFATPL